MFNENNFSNDYRNYLIKILNNIKEKSDIIIKSFVTMQIEMEKYLKNSLMSSLDFKENIINCIVWLNENKINSNDDIYKLYKKKG